MIMCDHGYLDVADKNGKYWRLHVESEKPTSQVEVWHFSIGDSSFIWRNDRPLLANQASKKKPKWQLLKGRVKDARFMANVLDLVKQLIKEEEGKGISAMIEYARERKSY